MLTRNTPIIILAGEAGSGKDTVGNFIAEHHKGTCLGQADPMKRFCRDVFGFSEDQLWGPSELRNQKVLDLSLADITSNYKEHHGAWIDEVLPEFYEEEFEDAVERLDEWFRPISASIAEGAGTSPRLVLQTLGSEWGRSMSKDMWVNYAVDISVALLKGGHAYTRKDGLSEVDSNQPEFAIITDGRFPNEILTVRMLGGLALRIDREVDKSAVQEGGVRDHCSEKLKLVPKHFFSEVVKNDHTIDWLFLKIGNIMADAYDIRRIA